MVRTTRQGRSRRIRWAVLADWALVALLLAASYACREAPAPGATNLVLITLDTVRADRIGAYGYGPARTPVLDDIASRGVRFEDAIAQATTTSSSHASILTGLNPFRHGLRRLRGERLPAANETLAERLRARGFTTAAFVSGLPLRREVGLDQGFNVYDDDFRGDQTRRSAQADARQTNSRVLRWLETDPDPPVFLWVHYFDPHYPYAPPEAFVEESGLGAVTEGPAAPPRNRNDSSREGRGALPSPEAVERTRRLYDAELAYVDAAIGELLLQLGEHGLLDHAVLAVVADHGEHLGEEGYYFGHWDVLDETARVPMLLAHSDGRHAGRVIESSVGTIDLMPTLLAWLSVDAPLGIDGRDLTDAIEGQLLPERPLYTEQLEYFPVRAVRAGPWLLRQVSSPGRPIEDGKASFGPRGDGSVPESPDDATRAAFERALRGEAGRPTRSSEPIDVPEAVRAELEALGYTGAARNDDR